MQIPMFITLTGARDRAGFERLALKSLLADAEQAARAAAVGARPRTECAWAMEKINRTVSRGRDDWLSSIAAFLSSQNQG